ncbi:hypothetical protein [Pseudochrobactrum sp. MP213Fo]|uniref:hypothetical protein n=1 Tax=Pseudochrobactrum sp. MP213Fo TaxID=3022250 RepID=UPI003B9DF6A7
MRKTVIALIGVVGVITATCTGTYFYTMSVGKQSLRQLAQDGGFCKQPDCTDGIDYASSFLSNEFGLSSRGVQWCIGVDEIAGRDFILGQTVRNLLTEVLYIPCNEDDGAMPPVNED